MSDVKDLPQIQMQARLAADYAHDAAILEHLSPELHQSSLVCLERALRRLAIASGYRLVPANDRETEDA